MKSEHDFSKGERGKYADRYRAGTNIVRLDPEISEAFPTSESVNAALKQLPREAESSVRTSHHHQTSTTKRGQTTIEDPDESDTAAECDLHI